MMIKNLPFFNSGSQILGGAVGDCVTLKDWGSETRLLPSKDFGFINEISICDNKVAITSFENKMIGIMTESDAIAYTQRGIFKMAREFAQMQVR